jgi:hypothetical protein
MKMRLYVAYDRVAEEAGPVFQAANDGVAARKFRQILQEVPAIDLDGYKLYSVGQYDSTEMLVTGFDVPLEVLVELGDRK